MNRPHVYLHVAGMNHYREIVAEIMAFIDCSGLYDEAERLTAVCSKEANLSYLHGERWRIITADRGIEEFEFPTLQVLRSEVDAMPDDTPVFYCHTKGASATGGIRRVHKDCWRKHMLIHLVANWRSCVQNLAQHECTGTEWVESGVCDWDHFSGNYWWARADYLKKTPVPMATLDVPFRKSVRYIAEMWIGSGRPQNPKSINSIKDYTHGIIRRIPESVYRRANV